MDEIKLQFPALCSKFLIEKSTFLITFGFQAIWALVDASVHRPAARLAFRLGDFDSG